MKIAIRMTLAIALAATVFAPLAATPAAAATSQETCAASVQGKVAWDRQGHTHWSPDHLRRLCETTTLVEPTIECFRSEIKNHGDWERAAKICTEGRHEVEVLYVVPKGRQARPGIENAISAMMAVAQRHYFQQLGVTFKLRSPLVQTVHIEEMNEAFKPVGEMFKRRSKFAENRFKTDYLYKENAIVCFFESDTKALAGGGRNLAGLPAYVWGRAYDQFHADSSSDLSNVFSLGTITHEMGHGFGLLHTGDVQRCFRKHGIDLGILPSLIMQFKPDPAQVTVYDRPFHAEEKRLLLTPGYLPDCLPFNRNRPHPTWYLRHPLPKP